MHDPNVWGHIERYDSYKDESDFQFTPLKLIEYIELFAILWYNTPVKSQFFVVWHIKASISLQHPTRTTLCKERAMLYSTPVIYALMGVTTYVAFITLTSVALIGTNHATVGFAVYKYCVSALGWAIFAIYVGALCWLIIRWYIDTSIASTYGLNDPRPIA